MAKPKELVGQVFDRLTVIQRDYARRRWGRFWFCRCECGNLVHVSSKNLIKKHTGSCGCLHKELVGRRAREAAFHGHCKNGTSTTEYRIWTGMKDRCLNRNTPQWINYGGRGIKVCERWLKFENFFEDMGKRPEGLSLDRINVDGDYEPSNCRWATRSEQQQNKRNTKFIEINGVTKTFPEWQKEVGGHRTLVYERHKRGWRGERLLLPPKK